MNFPSKQKCFFVKSEFFYFHYLFALVVSAMGTHSVGQLLFLTIGTNRQFRHLHGVMRPALVPSCFRMSSFRVCHNSLLLIQK